MAQHEGLYTPKLITCTIAAPAGISGLPVQVPGLPDGLTLPFTVTGRAADNFFSVTNATDMISMSVGAEGNATHVINSDETGNISIVLTRGSFYNRVLSILFRAQRLIGEGAVPPFTFGVTIRDNNALPPTSHAAFQCLIMRQPDDAFGAADGTITWGFMAAQIVSNFSGRVKVG
jgi:hypothetical protein